MKSVINAALLFIAAVSLSGCFGESLCDTYQTQPKLDRNDDGVTDYRVQVIGDSILAYHDILCKSVGHRLGMDIGEQVLTNPKTGALVNEIHSQYIPPPEDGPDYEYIIVDGGINDLIANEKPEASEEVACDCNSAQLNHEACLQEVEDVTYRMNALIDTVQSTSSATVALLAYYPPENEQSFIGACFPYVDQLNENFREMADLDPGVQVLETYGAGIPIIQKASPLGKDNYHPTPNGSEQMSFLIQTQLNL